ncbi:846f357c-b9ae-4e43-8754-453ebe8746e2-CDS [Sclerotinia trifoliorum]|uniref:846f357c-b9ae-4e43-8754-453ebe8746e2-CDS n=1 Tax=Sclerotinia trifoliorum TaxID=28548 RepID=A0A8H2W4B8_9HELO|nr:846f357c-b9ae-4e43-8754-453ebe8746e2-CDS [Sclerotinia trifoliorum]
MRRQNFFPAAARLLPKHWPGYGTPSHTAKCPPARVFQRNFIYLGSTPPKNPFRTIGTAPPPGKPQYFAAYYLFAIPIPRTEVLLWLDSAEKQRSSRAEILIFEIVFLGTIGTILYNLEQLTGRESSQKLSSSPFDSPRFTKFTIVSEENVSSTSKLLTIRPRITVKSDPYAGYWKNGLWSVEFKQPLLQIARSYTPLPPDENNTKGDLRFFIRKEPNGEMSNYLFGLQANSEVELRGPHVEFDLPQDVEEVVLAGGTGIAPAMQVVHTLLEARKLDGKRPRVRIIWANRRREECVGGEMHKPVSGSDTLKLDGTGLIVQQLQRIQQKYPENLQVNYVVDDEGTFIDQRMISQAIHPSSEKMYGSVTAESNSKLLFVSGPEGFINHFAGPKKWWNGRQEQGELGGILGRMGVGNWKVFKL